MLLILFHSTFDLCNLLWIVQDNQTGILCSNPSFQLQSHDRKKKILNSLGQPDQHKILSLERCKVEFNALFLNWDFKSLGNYKTNIAERKEHWWYIGQKKILIWVALMKVFSHKYRYHDITVFTTSVLKTGRRILSSPLKKEPLEY